MVEKLGPLAIAVRAMSTTSSPKRRPLGQPAGIAWLAPFKIVSPPMKLRRLNVESPWIVAGPVVVFTRMTSGMKIDTKSSLLFTTKFVLNTVLSRDASSDVLAYLANRLVSEVGLVRL